MVRRPLAIRIRKDQPGDFHIPDSDSEDVSTEIGEEDDEATFHFAGDGKVADLAGTGEVGVTRTVGIVASMVAVGLIDSEVPGWQQLGSGQFGLSRVSLGTGIDRRMPLC